MGLGARPGSGSDAEDVRQAARSLGRRVQILSTEHAEDAYNRGDPLVAGHCGHSTLQLVAGDWQLATGDVRHRRPGGR